MSKVARIPTSVPASTLSSEKSDVNQLVSVTLFSAIGLLVSLVAVIMGVKGVWL